MCAPYNLHSPSGSSQEQDAGSSTLPHGYGIAARYRRQSSQRSTQTHSEEDSDSLGTTHSSSPDESWSRLQHCNAAGTNRRWDLLSSSSTPRHIPLLHHSRTCERPQLLPMQTYHGGKLSTAENPRPSHNCSRTSTTTLLTTTTTTTTTTMTYRAAGAAAPIVVVAQPDSRQLRKIRSSAVPSARSAALGERREGATRSQAVTIDDWRARLVEFLASPQDRLFDVSDDTIVTTFPDGTTRQMTHNGGATDSSKGRRRGSRMATHRFLLPVEPSSGQSDRTWARVAAVAHGPRYTMESLAASGCLFISCVRWQGELWITTSDICHVVKFRLEAVGFVVTDREKLFEGVYSDLRVVSKGCFRYEESQGAFLTALDVFGCISMHKRQKLYRWERVPHEQLLSAALRRAVRGGRACQAVRGVAVELCSGQGSQ